jgi:3-oxoacyl-[acyl-carrier-protein] synthase-3
LSVSDVGALIVVSEAPSKPVGSAAVLHHRLGLACSVPALEMGNACTGFLAALWTAQRLVSTAGAVLVIAVEAPSRRLTVEPGPAGEAAALFGDAAAGCLVTPSPVGSASIPLRDVAIRSDGGAFDLLRVNVDNGQSPKVEMNGPALAGRAVKTMADVVTEMTVLHGLHVADLVAVVAHGGNGRMPALLARTLGIPGDKVWSTTADTGNLGTASLPAAWAIHGPVASGPVVWVAVGAGLQWGAALSGQACGFTTG